MNLSINNTKAIAEHKRLSQMVFANIAGEMFRNGTLEPYRDTYYQSVRIDSERNAYVVARETATGQLVFHRLMSSVAFVDCQMSHDTS